MKKTVTVTIEKQIEIEIPDQLLTPEYIKEFSSIMWEVDEPEDLITYVARKVFEDDDYHIEGMGKPGGFHHKDSGTADIFYSILYEHIEVDIDGETHYD